MYYNFDTQHYYQFILQRITWIEAYNNAKNITFMGRTGYLATIMSLKVELTDGETDRILAEFNDANTISGYAKESIAKCIRAGIVTGRNGKLIAPKDNVTRAETTVLVRRLLQKSDLI